MSFWFTGFYLPSGRSQFWGNTRWQLFEEIKFSDTLKIFAAFSSFSSNVAPPDVMTERGEQLISLAENRGEQLKRWSNHRESDVVWQSRPNGGREKNHTKKSFHRLVDAISKSWREDFFFTFGRQCSRRIGNVKTRRGKGRNGGGIIHQLWLIPSLFHSHVSYRTLRRSQRYQAQAQRCNQLFLFSL